MRQEDNYWNLKDIVEEEFFQIHPHGFMVRLGGESGKYIWLPCAMVGRNMVVPFVFP